MEFVKKYEALCAQKGFAPSKAAVMAGLSNAVYTGWLNGSVPRKSNLLKLCRFFDVPEDYFDETEKTAAPKDDGMTDAQRSLIQFFDSLDPAGQDDLLAVAKALSEARRSQDAR